MAKGHPQAYFHLTEVLASHDTLDPVALLAVLPGHDGLRVSAVEGVGLVAARRVDDFTHVVAGVPSGAGLHGASFWRVEPGPLELDALEARPVDLGFLADAPAGVATRLLDAALAGPVVFFEPDDTRRAAWVEWLNSALPGGAGLTFSTAGDDGVRVSASAEPIADAIDATEPCDLAPTLYARVAQELAARGELIEAVARLDEPDGLSLAVYGGATDLLAPHQLPLALQLIIELATSGEVALAARAADGLPTAGPTTALAVRDEPAPMEIVALTEPDEILDAEVVEEDEVIDATFEVEPEPEPEIVEPPGPFETLDDDEVIEVPFEAVPVEPEPDLEPEPEPEPAAEEPEMSEAPEDEEPDELPDMDAWSSLLAELKTESVQPDESLPPMPEIEERRIRDRFVTPPAPAPVAEEEPEVADTTIELGISLEAFAQSLSQAPAPSTPEPEAAEEEAVPEVEVIEEREVGMSLADLEASLKRGEQP
ncbi:hypothetical protein OJ997_12070 [Solirubrobacter phytolaccae]|uniref:Uncharacterized protein n=1 Tax=Solirubrobacter phytolaccae TaxID=1404360 RepID=A0A9X3N9U2_9ACTN|nr:hypothetical protein [Solirubrobacter phytolaccae]MDA0181035.1 hypothetical protein [Solirubrobacter phytolaccae]